MPPSVKRPNLPKDQTSPKGPVSRTQTSGIQPYKPKAVQEELFEDESSEDPEARPNEEPIIFVDVALGRNQQPVRIAIYADSEPEVLARRFIKQQRISSEAYLDELVYMLQHAKDKAVSEKSDN